MICNQGKRHVIPSQKKVTLANGGFFPYDKLNKQNDSYQYYLGYYMKEEVLIQWWSQDVLTVDATGEKHQKKMEHIHFYLNDQN